MQAKPLVLIGQGLWLQMASALLAKFLQPYGFKLIAIELPAEGIDSGAVCCGVEIEAVCDMLAISLPHLITTTQGTISLGCQYQSDTRHWFVPYAHYGMQAEAHDFEQTLLAHLCQGFGQSEDRAESYSIAAMAAAAGKFAFAPPDKPRVKQALAYGVHVSRHAFATYLKNVNTQLGVRFISCQQLQMLTDETGTVTALKLDGDQQLAVGFCFDCRAQPVASNDHSGSDQQWVFSTQDSSSALHQPHSSALHTEWGWLLCHPLQQGRCWQLQACLPAAVMPADVIGSLRQLTGLAHWHYQPRLAGTEPLPWQANVVRCGAAAAGLHHPLYDGVAALQYLVVRWLDLMPASASSHQACAVIYNQHWQQYQQEVQMYLQCHQDPLATAQGQLFARLGRLLPAETDAIKPAQWFGLLLGLGLKPQLQNMLVAQHAPHDINAALQQLKQTIAKFVAGMPDQAQTLAMLQTLK